ncbi:MAG: sulfatase-like hydrolase/transferase, partial [Candidatus Aminicenantes bacterium]|nr:sulfatase-like hydrolase/transferase [Candidatus Aminicenantes bacterium]
MTRSNKSSSVVILLINLFLILFCLSSSAKAEKSKLNVILITIDTLRADRLSCYSEEHVKTPHIDALAERSVIFTKAFAHNPLTLPSHTNILLGTTPLSHGVQDNVDFVVPPEFLTMAEQLKKYGYSTGAFIGAAPLDSRFGLDQGFDLY